MKILERATTEETTKQLINTAIERLYRGLQTTKECIARLDNLEKEKVFGYEK